MAKKKKLVKIENPLPKLVLRVANCQEYELSRENVARIRPVCLLRIPATSRELLIPCDVQPSPVRNSHFWPTNR